MQSTAQALGVGASAEKKAEPWQALLRLGRAQHLPDSDANLASFLITRIHYSIGS